MFRLKKFLTSFIIAVLLCTLSVLPCMAVEINVANFPDEAFRHYVKRFDTDGDGDLSNEEISKVKKIDIDYYSSFYYWSLELGESWALKSLKGIECFTNLEYLSCIGNGLGSIDVTRNTALKQLFCSGNGLTQLDVSKNVNLITLGCNHNNLTKLDISNNTKLTKLHCQENNLKVLDVRKNIDLITLYCQENQIMELNLMLNTKLQTLCCYDNPLIELNLSNNKALNRMELASTTLKILDISNTAFEYVDCIGTDGVFASGMSGTWNLPELIEFRACNMPVVQSLRCGAPKLSKIYVQNNNSLKTIAISNTLITGFDAGKNFALEDFYCSNNSKLTKINLSGNRDLQRLSCYKNESLKKIDVSKNIALKEIDCYNNQLTALDVSKNTALNVLNCYNNKLTKLDLSKNIALKQLNCENNQISKLDVNNTVVSTLRCSNNQLTELEVRNDSFLTELYCENNKLTGIDFHKGAKLNKFSYSSQKPTGLKFVQGKDYLYRADLGSCLSKKLDKANIKITSTTNVYDNTTGIVTLSEYESSSLSSLPEVLGYKYETGLGEMNINLNTNDKPLISTRYFPNATADKYHSVLVKVTGKKPFTFTYSGDLPEGLSFRSVGNDYSSYAEISGTPKNAGTTKFKVIASNDIGIVSRDFSLTVLKINFTFPNGSISGGSAPYKWEFVDGTLPEGTEFYSNGAKFSINGTPTLNGNSSSASYNFKVKVTDKNGCTAEQKFQGIIKAPTFDTVLVRFNNGFVKKTYSTTINALGGTAPYKWTVAETLPKGLKLKSSGNQATLTGTPKQAGDFKLTLKVTDRYGFACEKAFNLKITATEMTGNLATTFPIKTPFYGYLFAAGGSKPYTWTVGGKFPKGLSFDVSESTLKTQESQFNVTGTPQKAGIYKFKVTVTDSYGASASKSFTLEITKPVISGSFDNGVITKSYYNYVTVSGGKAPYKWEQTGNIPEGLTFSYDSYYYYSDHAYIRGTPSKTGTYKFTLKVTDSSGVTASKKYTVKITQPKISGTFTKTGVVKSSYSSYITISGGTAPYSWTLSNDIPVGLKLKYNSTGTKVTLSGKPTKAGNYKFILKAKDVNNISVSKSFTVKITAQTKTVTTDITQEDGSEKTSKVETDKLPEKLTTQINLLDDDTDGAFSVFTENIITELNVLSNDILWQGTDKDEDIVGVQVGQPVTFVIGEWVNHDGTAAEVSDVQIFIDDEVVDDVNVSELGMFTIQPKFINGDFKVQAKAKTETSELETQELFISVEE